MVLQDLYVGIPTWREEWVARRNLGRIKGVWDPSIESRTFALRDGRKLSYFLDGHSTRTEDVPHVFVFHAMCLSGNCFIMEEPPRDFVLVCLNRPGYFSSSPVDPEKYDYGQFADDVAELADHLGVAKFSVVGHSSGGPCALACAALLPCRVTSLAVLAGDPEYAHPPNERYVNRFQDFCLGRLLPFVLNWIAGCLPMARGMRSGLSVDFVLERREYPFRTKQIHQPALVCAGEKDGMVPPNVVRSVYDRLVEADNNGAKFPSTEFRVYPNKTHCQLLQDSVLAEVFEMVLEKAGHARLRRATVKSSGDHETGELTACADDSSSMELTKTAY